MPSALERVQADGRVVHCVQRPEPGHRMREAMVPVLEHVPTNTTISTCTPTELCTGHRPSPLACPKRASTDAKPYKNTSCATFPQ